MAELPTNHKTQHNSVIRNIVDFYSKLIPLFLDFSIIPLRQPTDPLKWVCWSAPKFK